MEIETCFNLAISQLNKYELTNKGWQFKLDRAKRRAGCCKHRIKTITLSQHYVSQNTDEDILDTLLHEIAHALVGSGHGHDLVWKRKCVEIGAKPIRCYDSDKVKMPDGVYKAKCGKCGREFCKHRKVKRKYYCLSCGPKEGALNYEKVEK